MRYTIEKTTTGWKVVDTNSLYGETFYRFKSRKAAVSFRETMASEVGSVRDEKQEAMAQLDWLFA